MTNIPQFLVPQFEQFSTENNGPEGLKELRKAGWEEFKFQGIPHKKMELWRFSNLTPFFQTPKENPSTWELSQEEKQFLNELDKDSETLLVFVNGQFAPSFSSSLDDLEKVHLTSLKTMLQNPKDLEELRKLTSKFSNKESQEGAFTPLNQAFMEDGIFLKVESKGTPERPIHLYYTTTNSFKNKIKHPRNFVQLCPHAQVNLIESYHHLPEVLKKETSAQLSEEEKKDSQNSILNAVTDILLEDQSLLNHCQLVANGSTNLHVGKTRIIQLKNSEYYSLSLLTGGGLTKSFHEVKLEGERASCHLNGLYTLHGNQHAENYLSIHHKVPNTNSEQVFKGILNHKSHAVFHGKVSVAEKAQQISAQQINKNLLLSNTAHVDTQPQLEILADDVKCSHGATIGQLNPKELFYLQSRGISPEKANFLLAMGFINDVILKFPSPSLQQKCLKALLPHLGAVLEQEIGENFRMEDL